MSGLGTSGRATVPRGLNSIIRVEVENVGGRVVGSVFRDKGGGDMVRESWCVG